MMNVLTFLTKGINMCAKATDEIYNGFKIRFANLTHRLNLNDKDAEQCIIDVCSFLTEKMGTISTQVPKGNFTNDVVKKREGEMGGYLEFPVLNFTAPINQINLTAIIRINPCFLTRQAGGDNHYSKIWINVFNNNSITIGSERIYGVLEEARYWCTVLSKLVIQSYIKICQKFGDLVIESNDIDNYWLSIDTLSLQPSDDPATREASLNPLFETKNRFGIENRFKHNTIAKKVITNIASCLNENPVEDAFEHLKKYEDVKWKVRKSDNACVFYGQRSTSNFFHIVGAGLNFDRTKGDVYNIDNLFKPTVAGLVSAL